MKKASFILIIIISLVPILKVSSQQKNKPVNKKQVYKQWQSSEQDLFVAGKDNAFEYRIPSIITTNKGTLIAVCDARVDKPGDAPNNIDLVMKKSYDNGKTWSELIAIADFPGNDAGADASMVVDRQTGTIWLAYDYAVSDPQGHLGRIIRIHLIKSDDDGNTWSPPVDLSYLTKGKNFWLQNSPGVGLYSDGIIIIPMYSAMIPKGSQLKASTPDLKGTQQLMLVYSEDHGKTWLLSNGVGEYNSETQIACLKGGKIMANMRRPRGHGCRQVSITDDLGKTWSEVHNDSTLIEPGCQASLINYKFRNKSLLIFSNPADTKERKNMVVRTSNDEGKFWQKEIPVYGGSAGYSCMTQLQNGNIGLLYEKGINYKKHHYEKIVFIEIPHKIL